MRASLARRRGRSDDRRLRPSGRWRTGAIEVAPTRIASRRARLARIVYGSSWELDFFNHHQNFFVRHFLPVGEPLISHDITMTVRRAFRRAGLVLPSMGAHVLRHTTASRLVRAGVSLKYIADVMRHRDIDTTRIYTKVDWPRLAEVALAWPTVAS